MEGHDPRRRPQPVGPARPLLRSACQHVLDCDAVRPSRGSQSAASHAAPDEVAYKDGVRFTMNRSEAWIVVALVLASCGPTEEDRAPLWHGVEVARIGSLDDPSTSFHRVSDIARDEAGRIYVADAGNSVVRVYDRSGEYIRDIGRPGPGPGEFEHLDRVIVLDDTVYATHARGFRAVFFDTSGAMLAAITAAAEPIGSGLFPQLPSWQFDDGTGVARTAGPATNEPRLLLRTDRFGAIIDTLRLTLAQSSIVFEGAQRRVVLSNPFARPGAMPVFSRDGRSVHVTVHPADGLSPGEFRLAVGPVGGAADWERVYQTAATPYSTAKVDSLIREAIRPVAGMVTEAEFRRAVAVPRYEYPVREVHFDHDGGIWVQLAANEAFMTEWLVLDGRGIQHRRVRLPVRARPRIMTADTAFVIESDEFDVQYVVEYRLVERAPLNPRRSDRKVNSSR